MCRVTLIIGVLFAIAHMGSGYNSQLISKDLEGCSIASDVELGLIDNFKGTSLQMNVTKKDEILRSKLYFKGLSPIIIIQFNSEQGMTFGQVDNSSTFGIYEKYSDFTASRKVPKISKSGVKVFSESYYTEMDVILTKGEVLLDALKKFSKLSLK